MKKRKQRKKKGGVKGHTDASPGKGELLKMDVKKQVNEKGMRRGALGESGECLFCLKQPHERRLVQNGVTKPATRKRKRRGV